ncbi:MAG: helix-turn-helix domain-containing protein [candidate division WOR-3 bacterium]
MQYVTLVRDNIYKVNLGVIMSKDEIIEKMTKLGITETEARIYTALLEKPELTAQEIYFLTGVPRTKVYEIGQRMVQKGMCIEKLVGNRRIFQAIGPKRAFRNLLKHYENDLLAKKKLSEELIESIHQEYEKTIQQSDLSEFIEIIKGPPSIHSRFIELLENVKKEVIGFVRGPFVHQKNPEFLKEQRDLEFRIIRKGIIVKALYEIPKQTDLQWLYSHLKRCIDAGEKARVIERLPVKMFIFDRNYVLMALDNRHSISPLTMIGIEHPALAQAGIILFDTLWTQGQEYNLLKSLIENRRTHNG